MERINCKPVYCWAFIFSLTAVLSGCVPEEMSEGYKLYSAKCSACHRLLPPENYPLEKFGEYIEKYGKQLTVEEKNKIISFIKTVQEHGKEKLDQ